jgi:hypothetical protein
MVPEVKHNGRKIEHCFCCVATFKDTSLKHLAIHGNDIGFEVFTAVSLETEVFCWVLLGVGV